jgi:hypothetical protein
VNFTTRIFEDGVELTTSPVHHAVRLNQPSREIFFDHENLIWKFPKMGVPQIIQNYRSYFSIKFETHGFGVSPILENLHLKKIPASASHSVGHCGIVVEVAGI